MKPPDSGFRENLSVAWIKTAITFIAFFSFPALLATNGEIVPYGHLRYVLLFALGAFYVCATLQFLSQELAIKPNCGVSSRLFILILFPASPIFRSFFIENFRFENYDAIMHFLGGAFVIIALEAAFRKKNAVLWFDIRTGITGFIRATIAVLFVGVLLEAYQWHMNIIGPPQDTILDIVCDIAGGWFIWLIYYFESRSLKSLPHSGV